MLSLKQVLVFSQRKRNYHYHHYGPLLLEGKGQDIEERKHYKQ